jgi:ammonia channel protein AmtB
VFGVHGVGGFLGTVLVAIFASTQYGGFSPDLDIMKQLGVQLFAAVATAVYTAVATFGVLKVSAAAAAAAAVEVRLMLSVLATCQWQHAPQ